MAVLGIYNKSFTEYDFFRRNSRQAPRQDGLAFP